MAAMVFRDRLTGLLVLMLICYVVTEIGVNATLSKSDKKSKKAKKSQQGVPVVNMAMTNVVERGLVKTEMKASEILREHTNFCELEREVRHFSGEVLAYVTPWNSKGYDIAKQFHKKFTMVSPVWLQVKPKGGKCVMSGGHDIDKGWAQEVTRGGDNKIMPRVLFEGWTLADYQALYQSEDSMIKCIRTVTKYMQVTLPKASANSLSHSFDGLVLEMWSQTMPNLQDDMIHFLVHFADELHSNNKKITLVVPPANVMAGMGGPKFLRKHFDELKDSIDFFSVMTYDYHSQAGVAAPISPIEWVGRSITNLAPVNSHYRAKLLLGIHFYGIKFTHYSGQKPVIGHEFIQILKEFNPRVKWQAEDAEHSFLYKEHTGENIFLFYPSLLFLQERLKLAEELGVGVAIWEIGQGLDYFYDLL